MIEAAPEIRCVDFWPAGIPKAKLGAYKAMIEAGQITRPRVVINRTTGSAEVSYASTVPHEWIREEMGRISRGGEAT